MLSIRPADHRLVHPRAGQANQIGSGSRENVRLHPSRRADDRPVDRRLPLSRRPEPGLPYRGDRLRRRPVRAAAFRPAFDRRSQAGGGGLRRDADRGHAVRRLLLRRRQLAISALAADRAAQRPLLSQRSAAARARPVRDQLQRLPGSVADGRRIARARADGADVGRRPGLGRERNALYGLGRHLLRPAAGLRIGAAARSAASSQYRRMAPARQGQGRKGQQGAGRSSWPR